MLYVLFLFLEIVWKLQPRNLVIIPYPSSILKTSQSLFASKVKSWMLSVQTFQQNLLLWTRLKVRWSNQTAVFLNNWLKSHHHQQHLCHNHHVMYIMCITSLHHQQYLHHSHKILISKSFCLVLANQVPMLLLVTQAVPGPPRVPTVWPHSSFPCLRC